MKSNLCRACKGNPKYFLKRETCLLCKRNRAAWVKAGFENECNEMLYIHKTWLNCKRFNMLSTGSHSLDSLVVRFFGMPSKNFGTMHTQPMPKKVAAHTPEYVQGPIHLEK